MRATDRYSPWRYLFVFVILSFLLESNQSTIGQPLLNITQRSEHFRELYLTGKYEKALKVLQKEIDSRPELKDAKAFRYIYWISNRADILKELGRIDEAISDMETTVEVYPEPAFLYKLALLYRERGRKEDYKKTLETAWNQRQNRWSYHPFEENIVAMARIAELRGENPKQLLSSFYTNLMESAPKNPHGFVGAGDLCLRRGAYDLADGYYRQAVDIQSTHQDALAGLAETYWKTGDPRLEDTIQQILQINPNNYRAKAIQAEILLDNGDAKKTLELLDEPLAINPNQLQLRSLQAAAYFLLDATENLQSVRKRVLDFNPIRSEVDRVPGRIASRHYRFREGVAFQEKALQIDPDDVEARTQYGLDLLRLGEDEKGRKELERTFAADPYNVQVFNLLNLLDTLDTFETLHKGSFVIRFPKNETPVWSDEAFALLDEALQTYQKKYDVTLHTPIHVQIFDDHDDFMVRSVGLPGAIEFMGICFGELITMDSPSARTRLSMNWKSVLWHEFVHVVTLQKTNNRMPRWLSEGISVYEERQKSQAWGQKKNPQYKALIESEELPGVADLEVYFIRPKTSGHLMLGYYLASEFVNFYTKQYGADSLVAALEAMRNRTEALSALANACRLSADELDDAFQDYLTKTLADYQNLPDVQNESNIVQSILKGDSESNSVPVNWLEQPSPFTDAMREGKKAFDERRWDEAETAYERAFELFPDYQGEGAPLHQLTRIYKETGNEDKWIETLWRRAEWDSLDFEACQLLIAFHQQKQEWDRTAKAAELALSVDPFQTESRQALLQSYIQSNQYDAALREIAKLFGLDPTRKIDYQLERIQILLRLNQKEIAKKETILLLEEYPHLWKAQQTLLAITENAQSEG